MHFACVVCGGPLKNLIRKENGADIVEQCPHCRVICCDKYVEQDGVQLFMDMILLYPSAWAHSIYNYAFCLPKTAPSSRSTTAAATTLPSAIVSVQRRLIVYLLLFLTVCVFDSYITTTVAAYSRLNFGMYLHGTTPGDLQKQTTITGGEGGALNLLVVSPIHSRHGKGTAAASTSSTPTTTTTVVEYQQIVDMSSPHILSVPVISTLPTSSPQQQSSRPIAADDPLYSFPSGSDFATTSNAGTRGESRPEGNIPSRSSRSGNKNNQQSGKSKSPPTSNSQCGEGDRNSGMNHGSTRSHTEASNEFDASPRPTLRLVKIFRALFNRHFAVLRSTASTTGRGATERRNSNEVNSYYRNTEEGSIRSPVMIQAAAQKKQKEEDLTESEHHQSVSFVTTSRPATGAVRDPAATPSPHHNNGDETKSSPVKSDGENLYVERMREAYEQQVFRHHFAHFPQLLLFSIAEHAIVMCCVVITFQWFVSILSDSSNSSKKRNALEHSAFEDNSTSGKNSGSGGLLMARPPVGKPGSISHVRSHSSNLFSASPSPAPSIVGGVVGSSVGYRSSTSGIFPVSQNLNLQTQTVAGGATTRHPSVSRPATISPPLPCVQPLHVLQSSALWAANFLALSGKFCSLLFFVWDLPLYLVIFIDIGHLFWTIAGLYAASLPLRKHYHCLTSRNGLAAAFLSTVFGFVLRSAFRVVTKWSPIVLFLSAVRLLGNRV